MKIVQKLVQNHMKSIRIESLFDTIVSKLNLNGNRTDQLSKAALRTSRKCFIQDKKTSDGVTKRDNDQNNRMLWRLLYGRLFHRKNQKKKENAGYHSYSISRALLRAVTVKVAT